MIYANGDIYEGAWQNDLKHGYGILEKKTGDKYYGHWNNGLKEGQGYYYYNQTGKIYLGEWHEDAPRCGIFTDVDDENIKKEYKKQFKAEDGPPIIPLLKLASPESILEDSINNVQFLRNVKLAKNKSFHELFPQEFHEDLIKIFTQRRYQVTAEEDKERENKIPDNILSIKEFKIICIEKLGQEIDDETLELIFYVFEIPLNEEIKIDFLLFSRLFYLVYVKKMGEESPLEQDFNEEGDGELEFNDERKDDNKIMMNFEYSELNEYQPDSNIYEEEDY